MRTQVPYLARLARQSIGQEALRPPRQLFPGGTHSPARWPGADESASQQDSGAGAPAFPAGGPDGAPAVAGPRAAIRAGQVMAPLPQGSAPSAARAAEAQPPRSWPDALWGTPVDLPRTTALLPAPSETDGGTAALIDTGSRVAPGGRADRSPTPTATPDLEDAVVPLPQGSAPSAARAAEAQPPRSWPDPLWGTPVDLPRTTGLPPAPGRTEDHGTFAPRFRPTALTPGPGTERPAGAGRDQGRRRQGNRDQDDRRQDDHGEDSGDAGTRVTPGARPAPGPERSSAQAAAGPVGSPAPAAAGPVGSPAPATATLGRLQVPIAAPDLLPPSGIVPRSATAAGTGPDGRLQDPRASGQPRVSIGTIEVTVVPAAPPAPEIGRNRPPAPAAPGRSRPASQPAAGLAAGWAQGLRRWYGIAQG